MKVYRKVCTHQYDDMMYCHHSLYIPGCPKCMAEEFRPVTLTERPPEPANMGVQVYAALVGVQVVYLLSERLPQWDWLSAWNWMFQ